jgi:hypothetical protein
MAEPIVQHAKGNFNNRASAKVTGQSVGLPVVIHDSVANFVGRRKVPGANEYQRRCSRRLSDAGSML